MDCEKTQNMPDASGKFAFVKNTEAMGLDRKAVNYVVLSHGYYDHTGGVAALLGQLTKGWCW